MAENTVQEQKERLVEVDGQKMTEKQLNEKRQSMPKSERLTEVSPGQYRTLKRMQE